MPRGEIPALQPRMAAHPSLNLIPSLSFTSEAAAAAFFFFNLCRTFPSTLPHVTLAAPGRGEVRADPFQGKHMSKANRSQRFTAALAAGLAARRRDSELLPSP